MSHTSPDPVVLNDPKVVNGWAMFDWANSAYALVITTAIFPGYFNAVLDDNFSLFGIEMTDTALFSYSISFAYLIIAAMLPLLSGIADYGGKKLAFMKRFTYLGSISCMLLFFFTGMDSLEIGLAGFILAVIGFAGGQVFYNSYLPIIASEDQLDKVSAKGFSFGYIGSVILLIVNLIMISFPQFFGLEFLVQSFPQLFGESATAIELQENAAALAARISFVMVGAWWMGFAQIPFNRLPKQAQVGKVDNLLSKGYAELKKVFQKVKKEKYTKRFLMAFFCYSAGVQTAIFLASTFATKELGFETSELIIVVLILQIVAIGGAYLFAALSGKFGNKQTLILILIIWSLVCMAGYLVQDKTTFYAVAGGVGLVMGGVQSLSRSTYAKFIPEGSDDTASYFSFYDVLEKSAIVIGTFVFGFIDQILGGMRNSMLALVVFFVIGIIILSTVKIGRRA